MKRNRPRQHFRKLKGGKKIVVNRGLRRRLDYDLNYFVPSTKVMELGLMEEITNRKSELTSRVNKGGSGDEMLQMIFTIAALEDALEAERADAKSTLEAAKRVVSPYKR